MLKDASTYLLIITSKGGSETVHGSPWLQIPCPRSKDLPWLSDGVWFETWRKRHARLGNQCPVFPSWAASSLSALTSAFCFPPASISGNLETASSCVWILSDTSGESWNKWDGCGNFWMWPSTINGSECQEYIFLKTSSSYALKQQTWLQILRCCSPPFSPRFWHTFSW